METLNTYLHAVRVSSHGDGFFITAEHTYSTQK